MNIGPIFVIQGFFPLNSITPDRLDTSLTRLRAHITRCHFIERKQDSWQLAFDEMAARDVSTQARQRCVQPIGRARLERQEALDDESRISIH